MHDQHMFATEAPQYLGQGTTECSTVHPQDLALHPAGLVMGPRTLKIVRKPSSLRGADRVFHGGVMSLGEHKPDPQLFNTAGHLLRRKP